MTFQALVVKETSSGTFERSILSREVTTLPAGQLLIKVHYSSLNYKDALSATGHKGISRMYPHTPGIDAAGIVLKSEHPSFLPGEEVVVTGFDLGMNTSGGFSQLISVPASWVIKKPEAYDLKECMIIGTAGLTAALALHKMELLGLHPGQGPMVITGATGGVGSIGTALFSAAGYTVIGTSGKPNARSYLQQLGAAACESREWVQDSSGKPLLKPRWAGAVDTVGGITLTTLLKGCKPEGVVAATGLVSSSEFNTSLYPFLLNGVSLLGIASADTPLPVKQLMWDKLSSIWNIREVLPLLSQETNLEGLSNIYIPAILKGEVKGRIVVNLEG